MKAIPEPLVELLPGEVDLRWQSRPAGTTILARGFYTFSALKVEEVLRRYPAIEDCAFVQHVSNGACHAYLVPVNPRRLSHGFDKRKIEGFLRREGIPSFMHPECYNTVETLPKKGKAVDRAALAMNKPGFKCKTCRIPKIRNPLSTFTVEGVVWDRITAVQGDFGTVTLAFVKGAVQPTKITIRCPNHLMQGLRIGVHVVIQGEIRNKNILRATSWERKADRRTRIPLDRTELLLESLHG